MTRSRPWYTWQRRSTQTQIAVSLALLIVSVVAYLGPGEPPLNGLAEEIMARTPAPLANSLLENFGELGRPTAVLGAFALTLVAANLVAAAMLLPGRAAHLAGAAAAVVLTFIADRFGLNSPWWVAALSVAIFVALEFRPLPGAASPNPTRRDFLKLSVAGGAAVLLTANTAFFVALARNLAIDKDGGLRLFPWRNPHPREPEFALAPEPEVQEVRDFYLMSKNVNDPTLDEARWKLTLVDLAGEKQRFSLDDLQELPRTDLWATLRCVSNTVGSDLMGTALFSGVPLDAVLPRDSGARYALFKAADDHEEALSLEDLYRVPTLLAYGMNGRELSEGHGYPLRLLIPGRYGFKSVKWLEEIRLVDEFVEGTWEDRGWTAEAVVKTMSRIDGVVSRLGGGGYTVFGIAYGGESGVGRVEVRLDDGDWREAHFLEPLSDQAWVIWRHDIEASSGEVTVRAEDASGSPQPTDDQGPFPDGAQGLHSVTFG